MRGLDAHRQHTHPPTKERAMAVIVTTEHGTDNHPKGQRLHVNEDEHLVVIDTDDNAIAIYRSWANAVLDVDDA